MQTPDPTSTPMIWTWAGWEPLQYYRRLGGFHEAQEGNALWQDDWQCQLGSETAARALAEAGINWVTTHFYKGFGLDCEAAEIQRVAEMIPVYHRHGIRVFTYIQYGTIMPETIEAEDPRAANWGRVDWNGQHDGHPCEYGDQYWRRKPCANQPGFRDYLLACVDQAVAIGADGIWIDNLNADGCHCECCQAAFQAYLQQTVIDPWQEMGLPDLARVQIPRAERPLDPVFQAWTRFRCQETRTSLEMLATRARALDPDILVAVNIGLGNHQRAVIENGNWIGNLACVDYTYAENGMLPGWRNGGIVSQYTCMKLAAATGIKLVPGAAAPGTCRGIYPIPGTPDMALLERVFAETLFCGAHATNGPWGLRGEAGGEAPAYLRNQSLRSNTRELAAAFTRLMPDFDQSTDAAAVGILYSLDAMLGDEPRSRQAVDAMAQLLMQHQIPFRFVLSDNMATAEGLKLLILPHVLPVGDDLADKLREFVAADGCLLVTGRTSLHDETMRQRRNYALADVLGHDFSRTFEEENLDNLLCNPVNGCCFMPGEWPFTGPDGKPACGVPEAAIVAAVRDTTADALVPWVESPVRSVIAECRQTADGRLLLGLIDYADSSAGTVEIVFGDTVTVARIQAHALIGEAPQVEQSGLGTFRLPVPKTPLFLTMEMD